MLRGSLGAPSLAEPNRNERRAVSSAPSLGLVQPSAVGAAKYHSLTHPLTHAGAAILSPSLAITRGRSVVTEQSAPAACLQWGAH